MTTPQFYFWPAATVALMAFVGVVLARYATARDDTYEWTPASGPVHINLVLRARPPCDEDEAPVVIGGSFTNEFVVRNAEQWEPFCIFAQAYTEDGEPGPISEASLVRDTGWRPPVQPMPVPEPGRLVMLVAGCGLLGGLKCLR